MALSTARHPQTDGQTERVNQVLVAMLRAYVAKNKDSWAQWLPLLAHAYNSTPHDSTGYTPYFLLLGYEPRGPVDYVGGVGAAVGRPGNIDRQARGWLEELKEKFSNARSHMAHHEPVDVSKEAVEFAREMHNHRQSARDALVLASAQQARAYNKHRRVKLFEEGDKVLVNPHSLQWTEGKEGAGVKLIQRWTGPFVVQQRISDTVYDLAMPDSYPGSTIINIEHLKKYH